MFKNLESKILAIDPGYARLGFAILEIQKQEKKIVEAGVIETQPAIDWPRRILKIAEEFEKLLKKHKPKIVAIEKIFFCRNQKTALKIAEIKGILLYLAGKYNISVEEISPRELKMAITGYGLADKKQIQKIVNLNLEIPKNLKIDDIFDAIAIALWANLRLSKRYPQFHT